MASSWGPFLFFQAKVPNNFASAFCIYKTYYAEFSRVELLGAVFYGSLPGDVGHSVVLLFLLLS